RPAGNCDIGAYEALLLSIADLAQAEGDAGDTAFNFTVTLSSALPEGFPAVSVDYSTADGTASAPGDFTAIAGATLSFFGNEPATAEVAVTVTGDTVVEDDETFLVLLSNAVGAVIVDSSATGTILNDDAVPAD